jgi:hypothetical protein
MSKVIRVLRLNEQSKLPPFRKATPAESADKPLPPDEELSNWADVCPVREFPGSDEDEALLIQTNGTLCKYIACKGINALLFDEADRERLARGFASVANSCDSDVQILVISRNLPVDQFLAENSELVKTDNEYLQWYADYTNKWFRRMQDVHFVPQRDFYVIVTFRLPEREDHSTPHWEELSAQKQNEYIEVLNRLSKSVFEQLRGSNLRPQMLKRKEARDLIYAHLNPSLFETDPHAPASSSEQSETTALVHSALNLHDSYIKLDNKFVGTQYLRELPHETWMGWLVDLLTLSVEYSFSFFIHCLDQDRVRRSLKLRYQDYIQSSDPEVRDDAAVPSEIEEFLRGSGKAFDISVYIKTYGSTPENLSAAMDEVRRVFRNRDALIDRAQMMQLEAWQSTLPLGIDKMSATHRITSEVVGTFWPFFTAACGTPDGVPFGFAIASREPVLLNPFFRGAGKDANNMIVTGTTGSGTSFAVSMLILRLLPLGVRFVLVDKTAGKHGSYRFISEILGPEYSQYAELGSGSILNPFDLHGDDKPEYPSPQKLRSLLSLFDIMLAPEGREELSIEDKSLLDELIRATYKEALSENRVPLMRDIARLANEAASEEVDQWRRERVQQLSRGIALYTHKQAYGEFLDGFTNVSSDRLFTVFNLSEVNDARSERIASFLLEEYISRKAGECRKQGHKFAAIIEATRMAQSRAGAQLLNNLSSNSRQNGMMLLTVTQQLNDFFRHAELTNSVLRNAHMRLIMRQDPADLKLLQENLRLTDAELMAIDNFGSDSEIRRDSRGLLIVGGSHGTIRLVPSPMDYWMCTSEPLEDLPKRLQKIEEVKRNNPTINHTDACRQAVYYLGLETD